jgi:hypothetical protein
MQLTFLFLSLFMVETKIVTLSNVILNVIIGNIQDN